MIVTEMKSSQCRRAVPGTVSHNLDGGRKSDTGLHDKVTLSHTKVSTRKGVLWPFDSRRSPISRKTKTVTSAASRIHGNLRTYPSHYGYISSSHRKLPGHSQYSLLAFGSSVRQHDFLPFTFFHLSHSLRHLASGP